jgi:hypothetical protein
MNSPRRLNRHQFSTPQQILFSDYIKRRFPTIRSGQKSQLPLASKATFEYTSTTSSLKSHSHLELQIPESIDNQLKAINSQNVNCNLPFKSIKQTRLESANCLSKELKFILFQLCKLISDEGIIPLSDQEIILQKEAPESSQSFGKYEWHLDYFDDYFNQIKYGGTVPIFPHIFIYTGTEIKPTQTTYLPKGVDLNQFRDLRQFEDYLRSSNLPIMQKEARCQILSSDILHRAPLDRTDDFLLIGIRSIKETEFFDRAHDYIVSNRKRYFNQYFLRPLNT